MSRRYAITHVGEMGSRELTLENKWYNHYESREEAEAALVKLMPALRGNLLGPRADSLEVRPVECYPNGDAISVYFEEEGK
jgi:hypothetical protein